MYMAMRTLLVTFLTVDERGKSFKWKGGRLNEYINLNKVSGDNETFSRPACWFTVNNCLLLIQQLLSLNRLTGSF